MEHEFRKFLKKQYRLQLVFNYKTFIELEILIENELLFKFYARIKLKKNKT
jgi:hypothetical protein